jgi:hypothetical protein
MNINKNKDSKNSFFKKSIRNIKLIKINYKIKLKVKKLNYYEKNISKFFKSFPKKKNINIFIKFYNNN